MPQRARTFKVNCCLNIHNAHLKILLPISGYGYTFATGPCIKYGQKEVAKPDNL